MRGRRPGLPLDPDTPGPVDHVLADVQTRGRFQFPGHLATGINWLRTAKGAIQALAVLEDPGYITFRPWSPHGEAVVQLRKTLIEAYAGGETDVLPALRILEDQNKRVSITREFRITLTPEMLAHLNLSPAKPGVVYVWRMGDQLELLSTQFRNEMIDKGHPLL